MTRKEFSSKSEDHRRIGGWVYLGFAASVFAVMIAGKVMTNYLQHHYHTNRFESIGDIILILLTVGGFGGLACWYRYLATKWGLVCPNCGQTLIERNGKAALLTGNCPRCKNELFGDDAKAKRSPVASWPFSREEFAVRLQTITRQANRQGVAFLAMIFVLMFSCARLSEYLADLVEKGRLDWVEPEEWKLIAGAILGLVFLPLAVGVTLLAAGKKVKVSGVPCPECGRSLVARAGEVAISKGICIYCGEKLFEIPPAASQ